MLPSAKKLSIAIAVALGLALAAPLSGSAFAANPQPRTTAQEPAATSLRSGDLVRVASGGPLMVVTSVQDDQVKCSWADQVTGELKSETFPVAVLASQLTTRPADPTDEKDERDTDAYYKKHCPSEFLVDGKVQCGY
jgi:uncharacterized protein YodC (DUF2158 family)